MIPSNSPVVEEKMNKKQHKCNSIIAVEAAKNA
jgi:hypothetical protein